MYYVVSTEFSGFSRDRRHTLNTVEVRTAPPSGKNGQPVVYGWAGTADGWSTHVFGEFDTLEDARQKVLETFWPVTLHEFERPHPSTVETYGLRGHGEMTMGAPRYDY